MLSVIRILLLRVPVTEEYERLASRAVAVLAVVFFLLLGVVVVVVVGIASILSVEALLFLVAVLVTPGLLTKVMKRTEEVVEGCMRKT